MLLPGRVVDRFVVLHRLGEGGMATVFGVRHRVLGTRHALKVMAPGSSADRERLIREGRVQAHLDPTHVVPVTDVIEVDGSPALLMPWVPGGSLAELLRVHRPSEDEAIALWMGVVRGVAEAHAAGVVHRDLKPSNVLLQLKGGVVVPRVADFGLATSSVTVSDPDRSGQFVGTPSYAAPEQIRDAEGVDHRADLWSLGVMLYELLVGERPFRAPSMTALFHAITEADWDPQGVPARWRPALATLLRPEPSDRARSAAAVLAQLDAPPTRTLSTHSPVGREVRRRQDRPPPPSDPASEASRTESVLDTGEITGLAPDVPSLLQERDAFVGRDGELRDMREATQEGALITVVGMGGMGKTRLVRHLARLHRQDWTGGVWFFDLVDARTLDAVVHTVARTLDVPLGRGDPVAKLAHAIAGLGPCLLVFDNFEQLVGVAGGALHTWRQRAPEASVVVTSRTVLGLPGEVTFPLTPLSSDAAVQLFAA